MKWRWRRAGPIEDPNHSARRRHCVVQAGRPTTNRALSVERVSGMPPLVRAALENLREVAAKRLDDDAEAETKVVEVLARAAAELKKA